MPVRLTFPMNEKKNFFFLMFLNVKKKKIKPILNLCPRVSR
jgi:hypothetical protein